MREIQHIVNAFDEACRQGRQSALATLVHVDGSSYRRPGARMLVTDDGKMTGAISGGCLEGDALRKALLVLHLNKPMLVTYDNMDEDDAKVGIGLGCNGIIQVLIEPINVPDPHNPIELLRKTLEERQAAVLVTLFSFDRQTDKLPGTCLFHAANQTLDLIAGELPFKSLLLKDADIALTDQHSRFKNYSAGGHSSIAFIQYVPTPVSLVIVGSGNDVLPLADMANVLGWQTTVVDTLLGTDRSDRFANTCQLNPNNPAELLKKLTVDANTAVILMTHNYNYDLAMLKIFIHSNVRYIGSLGPKKKLDRMLHELADQGLSVEEERRQVLFGPAGLDVGAETPQEIALSILAEIKAVLSDKKGQSLRDKTSEIHARADNFITAVRAEEIFDQPVADHH